MDEDEIISVPFEEDDLEGDTVQYRTYRMDFKNKRIIGMVEGQEAAMQSIYKALQTRRYAHLIYDDDYGCDIYNKIGQIDMSPDYIESDIPAMIEDALLADEVVSEVGRIDFELGDIQEGRDSVKLRVEVTTIFGDADLEGVITNEG